MQYTIETMRERLRAMYEASQRRPGSKGPEARDARVDRKTKRAGGADLRLASKGRNRIQPSKGFRASTKTGSPAASRADKVAQRFAEPFAAARRSRSDGKRPRTSNELSAKRGSSTERKDVAARLRIRLQKRRDTRANESVMDEASQRRPSRERGPAGDAFRRARQAFRADRSAMKKPVKTVTHPETGRKFDRETDSGMHRVSFQDREDRGRKLRDRLNKRRDKRAAAK